MSENKDHQAIIPSDNKKPSDRAASLVKRGQSLANASQSKPKKERIILRGHSGCVNCSAFADEFILTGGDDANIILWNYTTGNILRVFKGHEGAVTSIVIMKNQVEFVSSSKDGTVRYWQLDTGRSQVIFDTRTKHIYRWQIPIVGLALSPSGGHLLICPQELLPVYCWNFWANQLFQMSGRLGNLFSKSRNSVQYLGPCGGTAVSISQDENFAAAASERTIFIWDFNCGEVYYYLGGPPSIYQASPSQIAKMDQGNSIADIMTKEIIKSVNETAEKIGKRHAGSITTLEFLPRKMKIISGSEDNTVRIWDFSDLDKIANPPLIIEGHTAAVRSVSVSVSGEYVLSGGDDAIIRMVDTATGNLKGIFEGHQAGITHITMSSDGDHFASCSSDGTVRIWALD